jgi:3-oxoacyl-[acyl-carrier-protein] synthase-3
MAQDWAGRIEELTGTEATRFLRYHGDNDDAHLDKLHTLVDRLCRTEPAADAVVTTARVVARLYALQLEEIDDGPRA